MLAKFHLPCLPHAQDPCKAPHFVFGFSFFLQRALNLHIFQVCLCTLPPALFRRKVLQATTFSDLEYNNDFLMFPASSLPST